MTPIPTLTDHLLCSDVVLIMSENAAPQNQGAGDESSAVIGADGPRRRVKLLTTELAQECATEMFTQLANGPHSTKAELIFAQPTIEEIGIAQAAVLVAIGEKGSEKRAHANSLCADGLIDLEQGLGYVLCDRFAGMMPSPIDARGVGKRAADKPAGKKEKERWKEKAKAARQAARKAGADDEAVAAAGQAARAKAEAAFVEAEVTIGGLERPADAPEPPAAVSEPEPAPMPPAPPPMPPEGTPARSRLNMLMSQEAEPVIFAAFVIAHATHPAAQRGSLQDAEQLELRRVRFKFALQRLKLAHPVPLEGCPWDEHSEADVIGQIIWAHSMGYAIPVAVAVAKRVGFQLERAAANERAERLAKLTVSAGAESASK